MISEVLKPSLGWALFTGGIVILVFTSLYYWFALPTVIVDPIFWGCGSLMCMYNVFLRKKPYSTKTRLINAFFGGAFILLFLQAISKLFAKLAVMSIFG